MVQMIFYTSSCIQVLPMPSCTSLAEEGHGMGHESGGNACNFIPFELIIELNIAMNNKVRENSADVWNSCSNPRASDTLFAGTFTSVANSVVTSSANGVRHVRVDMEIWEFP